MTVPLDDLPPEVRLACSRLRDELRALLGPRLAALWAYGAATRPDRPKRLGDVDIHCVITDVPDHATSARIAELQDAIADETGVEWDNWYIVARDARGADPPRHALLPELVDDAWSLHRAHWLAGEYVALHGLAPADLVLPPTWPELLDGLDGELQFIEGLLGEDDVSVGHRAYAVCNACRVVYSIENRTVVVSKRAAARWALDHLSPTWRPAIVAALGYYDDEPVDSAVLESSVSGIVAAARARLT